MSGVVQRDVDVLRYFPLLSVPLFTAADVLFDSKGNLHCIF